MVWTRRLAVLLLAALPMLATACSEAVNLPEGVGQSGTPSADVSTVAQVVTLQYSSFEPSIVTIRAGQSVKWVWSDAPIPHDVTFRTFKPAGGGSVELYMPHSVVQINGTWTQTFTKPGIYSYICTVHAGMDGEVIVTP
jgi:plastocyanin